MSLKRSKTVVVEPFFIGGYQPAQKWIKERKLKFEIKFNNTKQILTFGVSNAIQY